MIIATVAAIMYLFGSPDSGLFGILITNYAEESIKVTILDEEREEKALESLSLLNDDVNLLNEQISDAFEQFSSLVKDYESTPDDFDKLFSSTLNKRNDNVEKVWKRRSELLSHIEPKEWQTIVKKMKDAAQKEHD